MTMIEVGSGSRRAALTLHGMAEADRSWLLGELDLGSRQRLAALLGELRELGIPASPLSSAPVVPSPTPRAPLADPPPMTPPASSSSESAPALAALTAPRRRSTRPRTFSGGELHRMLVDETDAVVLRALAACTPRERRAALARFSTSRRLRLFEPTSTSQSPKLHGPDFDAAIRDVLSARATALPPTRLARASAALQAAAGRARSRWARLRAGWRKAARSAR